MAAVVDGDTDGGGQKAGDTGGLRRLLEVFVTHGEQRFCLLRRAAETHLQLSQGEATAGTDFPVVLDAGATNNRAETVDGAGGDGGGLGLACDTAAVLLAGLEGEIC